MAVDLKVHYRPWAGDHQVPAEEAGALVIDWIEANGERLRAKNPAITQTFEDSLVYDLPPDYELCLDGIVSLTVRHMDDKSWQRFEPDDWLEGSTQQECELIIRSVEFIAIKPEDWR